MEHSPTSATGTVGALALARDAVGGVAATTKADLASEVEGLNDGQTSPRDRVGPLITVVSLTAASKATASG